MVGCGGMELGFLQEGWDLRGNYVVYMIIW